MNNMIAIGLIVAMTVPVFAGEQATRKERSFFEETGGFVIKPSKKTNKIYFINAQQRASDAVIESARAKLDETLRVKIDMTRGSFELNAPKVEGELSLYIIDDEKLPMSLVAPEARWGVVNVAPLARGRGGKPAFFEARVRKEIARVGCMVFGGVGTEYKRNLLSFMKDPEALDQIVSDDLPVDGIDRCKMYLKDLGVRQWKKTTYRGACMEGWAPAPTNDIQKAIWDEVHKVPEKPIKITYDKDKQKPVVK